MEIVRTFFCLIQSQLNKTEIDQSVKDGINQEVLSKLYDLSKSHDLAPLLCDALQYNGLLGDNQASQNFKQQSMLALLRYERTIYEQKAISQLLESNGIDFMPLKGWIMRDFYRKPHLRTSCDIDLLVKEEDLQKAINLLKTNLKYTTTNKKDYHDVSLFSPSDVHLELHFSIKEKNEYLDKALVKVWENATLVENTKHQYKLNEDFFKFHILAHSAYHFLVGGCGIKPVIDFYLLENNFTSGENYQSLLELSQLNQFDTQFRNLANVWFNSGEHNPTTLNMEKYIVGSGVYGLAKNSIARRRAKMSKTKYIFLRIFPTYSDMKSIYTKLEKCPMLLPFYYVRRWFKVFAKKGLREEIKYNSSLSNGENAISKLCDELNLK